MSFSEEKCATCSRCGGNLFLIHMDDQGNCKCPTASIGNADLWVSRRRVLPPKSVYDTLTPVERGKLIALLQELEKNPEQSFPTLKKYQKEHASEGYNQALEEMRAMVLKPSFDEEARIIRTKLLQ